MNKERAISIPFSLCSIEEDMSTFRLVVVDAVKKAVANHAKKAFIVSYRLSPEERENPGITMKDTWVLVDKLADQPLDYLHLSVGGF